MANKAGKIGAIEIRDAEKLFEQSQKTGKPDFRYAALVIGENPLVPPRWAIEACIRERRRTERVSAFKSSDRHNDILDTMAMLLIEYSSENANGGQTTEIIKMRPLVWEAAKMKNYVSDKTDDDALRRILERWKEEQKLLGDPKQSIGGQKITPRISRIKVELFGEEFGTSKDPPVDAYWRYRKEVLHVSN